MSRRFVPLAAAVLCTSCLLEDPYFIEHRTSATEQGDDADDDSPGKPESSSETALPEPEPERQASNTPEPEPGPEPREITPSEPEPDILMDPTTPAVEPAPAPVEPDPSDLPEPDEQSGGGSDAGTKAPGATPNPAPDPAPDVDAGSTDCDPDAPDCVAMSGCGNGVVETGEACDGQDLAMNTCFAEGYSGGLLQCSAECDLDTSECVSGPTCDHDLGSDTGLVFQGNLNGQGNDTRQYSCSLGGRTSEDISLSWTAPSTGCFELSVDSTQAIDTVIGMYEDCGLDQMLDCDDEHGALNPDSILEFDAVANTTYAFSIDAYAFDDEGPIDVTITPCVSIPAEWTCPDARYAGGQGCDCGCGALDPDCEDETVDSCDNCGPQGACSSSNCGRLDPEQNWTCDSNGGPFGR